MSRWFPPVALAVVLLAPGCSRPAAPDPVLQPGDVVRPEVSFAPREPWPSGASVTIGVLLLVERGGGEARYLRDQEVDPEQAVVRARVTFLDGDRPLGDPVEVPFVRDC
jgi:hypothetical protein